MEKKYQVFISSTYQDLIEERKKAQEILLMADCIPAGMEAFVATNDEQFNVIKKVIDLCDYYVLIIGGRYGSINETTGISYTEMEYDYAVEKGIPVLVFAVDSSVDLPAEKKEDDVHKASKLAHFKEKAMNNRLASIWKDETDLSGKIAISIMKAKEEIKRPGWSRTAKNNEELLRQLNDLRIENEELKEQIQKTNDEYSEDEIDIESLAFEDTPIEFWIDDYYSQGYSTNITLERLFTLAAIEMTSRSMCFDSYKSIINSELCTEDSESINDDVTILKCLTQFEAIGLIANNDEGYSLTKKGKKKLKELLLIRKENK